jgi:uncharacterized protein (UPF0335 family)
VEVYGIGDALTNADRYIHLAHPQAVLDLIARIERLEETLKEVKKWMTDRFGPEDIHSKSLDPAFLKTLKMVHAALEDKP